jgi:Pin2-interacting protein X1
MASLQFLSKKRINALGSTINESAGSKMSSFALKQMMKMGWKEGEGLGRNGDGIASHIKVTLRSDNEGIASKEEKTNSVEINGQSSSDDQWWHAAFQSNAKKFRVKASNSSDSEDESKAKEKKKKSKKDKKEKKKKRKVEDRDDDTVIDIPSYEELFKATGGARLGMRARMSQKGKISRTEGSSLSDAATKKPKEVES